MKAGRKGFEGWAGRRDGQGSQHMLSCLCLAVIPLNDLLLLPSLTNRFFLPTLILLSLLPACWWALFSPISSCVPAFAVYLCHSVCVVDMGFVCIQFSSLSCITACVHVDDWFGNTTPARGTARTATWLFFFALACEQLRYLNTISFITFLYACRRHNHAGVMVERFAVRLRRVREHGGRHGGRTFA